MPNPLADECWLFKDSNFSGEAIKLKGYKYYSLPEKNFNDTLSSIKCGANVYVLFCEDIVTSAAECLNGKGQSQAGWISNP